MLEAVHNKNPHNLIDLDKCYPGKMCMFIVHSLLPKKNKCCNKVKKCLSNVLVKLCAHICNHINLVFYFNLGLILIA